MIKRVGILLLWSLIFTGPATAITDPEFVDHDEMLMDHGGGHMMDYGGGMVMGQNLDRLPDSCKSISEEVEITVHAGHKYAEKFPGTMFSFDNQIWRVKPCAKITWHFINEDNIRHQFMMHGLPKYVYKSGMFHLEVTGPGKISGTVIVPANNETYLVHCDIAQHMEKGMKGQLVVGSGGTDLPSIPGLTPYAFPDSYEAAESQEVEDSKKVDPEVEPETPVKKVTTTPTIVRQAVSSASKSLLSGMLVIGLAFGLLIAPMAAKRYKGMKLSEMNDDLVKQTKNIFSEILTLLNQVIQFLSSYLKKLTAK